MASGARQFTVKFLSDLKNFATEKAADGLERMGDSARTLGENLRRVDGDSLRDLGDDAQRGERALEGIGDEAREAANRVDDAFDRIRQASRSTGDSFRRVEDDAHEGFSGVKDEASETGREMASSFDGSVDSINDAFQELAANAGAAFGPVGLAIGIAAAVGIGALRNHAEEVKEQVDTVYQSLKDVADGTATFDEALVNYIDSLDAQQMGKLADEAEKYGLSIETVAQAMLGNADAAAQLKQAQDDYGDSVTGIGGSLGDFIEQMRGWDEELTEHSVILTKVGELNGWLREKMGLGVDTAREAAEAEQQRAEATDRAREATERAGEAEEAFSSVTQTAAEQVAEAHKDSSGEVVRSLEEVSAELDAQTKAAEDYAANVAIAIQRGVSQDAVSYLMDLPDGGARAFADLAGATDAGISSLNGKVGQFTLAKGMTQTIRDEKGNLISVTDANMDAVRSRINNAGLQAKIGLSLNGEASVEATLARLARDRTVRITTQVVGGQQVFSQAGRKML